MTITANGKTLANTFDPYVSGTKTCPAGEIYEGGTDIRNKYAPRSLGSKAANTGVLIGSTDISNYFAAKGSVTYWDGSLSAMPTSVSDSNITGGFARAEIVFGANGSIVSKEYNPSNQTDHGDWTGTQADSSNTEIKFSGSGLSYNGASSFVSLSTSRNAYVDINNGEGSKSSIVTVHLRQTGNASTEITKNITLTAQSNDFGGGGLS